MTEIVKAKRLWRELLCDIFLIAAAVVILGLSFIVDVRARHTDWFPRSGAVVDAIAGVLAYKSLARHYLKFYRNQERGYPLATSPQQTCIDRATLTLLIVGTLVWAYGDKLFAVYLSLNFGHLL